MKSSVLYNTAAALLVFFAGAHAYGMYSSPGKRASAETVAFAMRNVHFDVMGFSRTYWDFYFGFGMMVTVFLLFSAILSWHLGSRQGHSSPLVAWSFAACHAAVAALCWVYFFIAPAVVSTAVAGCAILAAAKKRHSSE